MAKKKQKRISTRPRHLDGIENDEYPLASNQLFPKKDAILYAIMLRRNGYNARVIKRATNRFMIYIKNNPNKEPATMKSVDTFINKINMEDTGNTIPTRSIENENSEILNDKSAVDIYQSKDGKKIFQIFLDEDPRNPREDDNLGIMVCFHRGYDLGDKTNLSSDSFDGWDELQKYLVKEMGAKYIAPLYLYDHSGLRMKIGEFSGLPQGHKEFDSGQVGFIYTTNEKMKEMGTPAGRVKAVLEGEVKTYDDYLSGNVYGFKVFEKDANGILVEKDSTWGYFGDDIKNEAKAYLGEGYKTIK